MSKLYRLTESKDIWLEKINIWIRDDLDCVDEYPTMINYDHTFHWRRHAQNGLNVGYLHRIDGPAWINKKNSFFDQHDIFLDHPPIIENDDEQCWSQYGMKHREDGPAWSIGEHHIWFSNGLRHRENGPAVQIGPNQEEWWYNGMQHRLDGPAVTYTNPKTKEWWVRDKNITADLKAACKMYDIPQNHNNWSDKDWVWFRLWVS